MSARFRACRMFFSAWLRVCGLLLGSRLLKWLVVVNDDVRVARMGGG